MRSHAGAWEREGREGQERGNEKKSVRFTISGRISNLTLDVMEGIVEAIYTKDRSYILERINLYIEKLRVMFRITYKRKYISAKQHESVKTDTEKCFDSIDHDIFLNLFKKKVKDKAE